MNLEDEAQFEVTEHYFLAVRGAILIGQILGDGIRLGAQIPTGDEPSRLTILGIDTLCNPQTKMYKQGLIFREQPTLEFLQRVFPVGTVIRLSRETDNEHTGSGAS